MASATRSLNFHIQTFRPCKLILFHPCVKIIIGTSMWMHFSELSLLPSPPKSLCRSPSQAIIDSIKQHVASHPGFPSPSPPEPSSDTAWALPDKPTAAALKCCFVDTEVHVTTFHQEQQANDSHQVPHGPAGTLHGCSSSTSPGPRAKPSQEHPRDEVEPGPSTVLLG